MKDSLLHVLVVVRTSIWSFHVVVSQAAAKKCTKVRAARATWLIFISKPIILWLSTVVVRVIVSLNSLLATFRSEYDYEKVFSYRARAMGPEVENFPSAHAQNEKTRSRSRTPSLRNDDTDEWRRYKTTGLVSKNNGSARVLHFGTFLCRRLLNDDVKWPNSRFCGGR